VELINLHIQKWKKSQVVLDKYGEALVKLFAFGNPNVVSLA